MNYLLEAPALELVEIPQINILLGLGIIIAGISIANVIINAIFKKRKKKGRKKHEETN